MSVVGDCYRCQLPSPEQSSLSFVAESEHHQFEHDSLGHWVSWEGGKIHGWIFSYLFPMRNYKPKHFGQPVNIYIHPYFDCLQGDVNVPQTLWAKVTRIFQRSLRHARRIDESIGKSRHLRLLLIPGEIRSPRAAAIGKGWDVVKFPRKRNLLCSAVVFGRRVIGLTNIHTSKANTRAYLTCHSKRIKRLHYGYHFYKGIQPYSLRKW